MDQSVVVCVTDQQSCVRLIHAGNEIALAKHCALHVLSVMPSTVSPYGKGDALDELFAASREVNAEMTVYYNDNPVDTTVKFLEAKQACDLVLGIGPDKPDGFTKKIMQHSAVTVHVIGKNGEHYIPMRDAG